VQPERKIVQEAWMAVIEAHGLSKRFGATLAVDDLSFAVEKGKVVGFLGPNGAGKTTTLRMLLGLVTPTAGTASINGQPYRALSNPGQRVGAVLEASGFHPGRTARNHLHVVASAANLPAARVQEVLEWLELSDRRAADRRVGGYSLGMRQRLALATALLGDPEVLILDEPGNGLDPEGIYWLRGFLRRYADGGRTVLVSSHVLGEVAQTVDEVVIISRGSLVTQATVPDLVARARPAVHIRTTQPAALRDLLAANGIAVEVATADRLLASGASPEAVGQMAAAGRIAVDEVSTGPPSLEQVFLELTATKGGDQPWSA
jgi:ABC-2 type transport system ATP-binding protein